MLAFLIRLTKVFTQAQPDSANRSVRKGAERDSLHIGRS